MIHSFLLLLFFGCFALQRGSAQQLQLEQPVRFLALGDSYTIGQSVPSKARWPIQLRDSIIARGMAVDTAHIIATSGWTTNHLNNAIAGQQLEAEDYNLVSLLIGVNDQYQNVPTASYPANFQALLDSAIRYAGNNANRVFVVSIPDYAYTPFGAGNSTISAEIDAYNAINDSITAANGVHYFNITPISRMGLNQPALVADDMLHPSALQYTAWVSLMMEYFNQQLPTVASSNVHPVPQFQLWPNPATNTLRISHPSAANNVVQVLNAAGQLVHTARMDATGRATINTANLKAGTYYLQLVRSNAIISSQQFIIQ